MAKKRSDKETGRLLIRLGIIGYFVLIFVTCHFSKIDTSNINDITYNLLMHILYHPLTVLPVDWEAVGIVTFLYFLVCACVSVSYEKQKQTRPGEESGSAQWNDDLGKFAAKYAELDGSKKIQQNTGWLDAKTKLPWKGEKLRTKGTQAEEEKKTKSFIVAIKNLINRKLSVFKSKLNDKWLDFKAKFYKDDSEKELKIKEPTEFQRKVYDKLCALEEKLNMDLNKYKPKACVEEKKRIEAEGEKVAALRTKRHELKPSSEKFSQTIIPVNRNMIMSQNIALSMDGRKTWKNNNVLILGGSGAGKTRFYLKPNLLQRNCSFVITDPSGEILETEGKFLEQAGYKIKVINLSNMEHSHCYNPFNYVRKDADILVMIDVLTKNLTPQDSHSSDPFWPKSQAALLQAIAFYLYKECRPSERNFTNVMKLLRAAVIKDGDDNYKSPLDIIFEDLEKKDPNHIAVMQYAIFKQAPAKTASTILTCAQVDLAPFNLPTIANLTSVDNIDLTSVGLEPTALFCITPTETSTYNWIISLAYTQLFESLYNTAATKCKGKRLPVHVRFLLDEFANIGQIPEFEQKLATMRKFEISCAIIIQNMAQLETMYKESWKTIVGNCDTFIYLGGHESSSTEYVSKMLGKQTIKSKNSSRTYGRQGSSNISLNATGRELMTPDEIAHMDDSECLVMIKGVMPFKDKKYDLLKHPNYKYTGDASDDLLYYVEKEIHTLNNKAFIPDYEGQYREMKRQAMHDARNNDRYAPIGKRKTNPVAINKENLVNAGMNNCFNLNDNLEGSVDVVGSNEGSDTYELPDDMKAACEENFDNFLSE